MQKEKDSEESRLLLYEEKRQKVRRFNLTSDIFFSKVMEDPAACQEVIRILTKEPLTVKSVKSQYSIRNIENRSIVLDVLAEDSNGRIINVEIHPQEDEDHVRRVRYHLSSLDMSFMEKGKPFWMVPEVYLIYITEKDFIGCGKGIYHVDRMLRNCEKLLDNGVREMYVNLSGTPEDEAQEALLSYMLKSESNPKNSFFPNLSKRVTMFKEVKEGVDIMCDIIDRERAEGQAEAIIALIRKKYEKQISPQETAKALEIDCSYVGMVMKLMEDGCGKSDKEIAAYMLAREL